MSLIGTSAMPCVCQRKQLKVLEGFNLKGTGYSVISQHRIVLLVILVLSGMLLYSLH